MAREPLVPESLGNSRARALFLGALFQHVPVVSKTLRTDVLPPYNDIPKAIREAHSRGPAIRSASGKFEKEPDLVLWRNVQYHAKRSPEVERMRDSLIEWSERFHLNREWLLDAALYTLSQWDRYSIETLRIIYRDRHPDRLRRLPTDGPCFPFTFEERAFELRDSGWEAGNESWHDFEKRIKLAFATYLSEYEKRLKQLAKDRGFMELPELRKKAHFDWLSVYQAAERSPGWIADHLNVDGEDPQSAILHAVHKTAGLIDLPLRTERKGNRTQRKT